MRLSNATMPAMEVCPSGGGVKTAPDGTKLGMAVDNFAVALTIVTEPNGKLAFLKLDKMSECQLTH